MKILVLNYEFPPLGGGASPVSYDIALELSKTGKFKVDVVTMGYKGLLPYEKINENFKIYRVKSWRSKKEICHPWEQLTYLITAYFKCRQLLKSNNYDLCHCHFIIPTGVLALILKKQFKLNYIITSHGSDVLGYNRRFKLLYPILKPIWKKIVFESKKISTPSIFLKNEIEKILPIINKTKIVNIPNGLDQNKFTPDKKEKIVLIVTRLLLNKGVRDALTALHGIDLRDWKVVIVGEGPDRVELERLSAKYKLNQKVTFLGWLNNRSTELRNQYGRASIFILPSHFENMNMTLLEAMASGCAILATNVGGNPEVIGTAGWLFPPHNPDALKKSLIELLGNEKERSLLSEQALQRFIKFFSWDTVLNQYYRLFHEKD